MSMLDGFMTVVQGAFAGDTTLQALLVKYYISVALIFYPVMRIIDRFGRNVFAALLLFVPLLGFVAVLIWLARQPKSKAGAS